MNQNLFVIILISFFLLESDASSQTFTDIAIQSGINFVNQGSLGGGASFVDFDQDGLDDITVASTSNSAFMGFYKNMGNLTFTSVSLPGIYNIPNSFCVLWADYDNDGDKDLFVSCWGTQCKLFRNDGGTFVDVTQSAGISTGKHHHSASAWGDYENDGWLDLYITIYRGFGGTPFSVTNYLFHN
jgi:hypothetical protein